VADELAQEGSGVEPSWYQTWFTTGSWSTEEESASALDRLLSDLGMFRVYREVPGTLTQPRVGQRERTLRIDRVLVPVAELKERGWKHGAVGVEIKRSGVNIGPPLAQAIDYVRGSWQVGGLWLQLGAVFLWPTMKQGGPIASLMVHNRIGTASFSRYDHLKFSLGEEVLLANNAYSGIRVGATESGRGAGSR
jgi:hypothetical protein